MHQSSPVAAHGVLFDVGYTLMDESNRLRGALVMLAQMGREQGCAWTPEMLREHYLATCAAPRSDEPSLVIQMLHDLGVKEQIATSLRRALVWDATPMKAYPDAGPALKTLREAGLRVGVLANQPASAREDLERAGLASLCDDIWLSDAVGLHKPDPAFFRLALSRWSMPAHRVAYVGDRPDNDVRAAKAIGLHTVLLRRPGAPHTDQHTNGAKEMPDVEAADLEQVAKHLCEWTDHM